MRNSFAGLSFRPFVLVAAALVGMLLLTNLFIPESTQATGVQQDQPAENEPHSADATLANCRYGASASPDEAHVVPKLGAGVFYDWRYNWPFPKPANDAEFLHMIRPRQKKNGTTYLDDYKINVPLGDKLAEEIRDDPGAIWIIGNEPERGPNPGETYSPRTDDTKAAMYATAYHDIYTWIKGIDPTARIANAGLIQITPMRLQYLNMVWEAYERQFGRTMPVDVWTIHAYVMPELTADGQPNSIASAALETDLSLGKRGSAFDKTLCSTPDEYPDIYCLAEHDDLSLLVEQIIAMREWMASHGQKDKPLIVTEFGTLYLYQIDNGQCRLRDEHLECFTPERVTKFMLDSFDMFNNLKDPDVGMPADNNKLVQQWIWYDAHGWDIGSSNLLTNDKQTLTRMGRAFRNHVWAEPTYVNLVVADATGSVVEYDQNDTARVKLTARMRNNGNVSVEKPFTVTFYKDAALTKVIGSTSVTPEIRGCAVRAYVAEVEWEGLTKGSYQFWVKLDRTNAIGEKNEADNIGNGQFEVTGPVYNLDVEIISDGEGVGGSVSANPSGWVYPEDSVVTVTAVPASGWQFDRWSGAIIGNYPETTVTMNADLTLKAHFSQQQYELSLRVNGEGEVSVTPQKEYYLFGEEVTLAAVPASEWLFAGWQGDIQGTNPSVEHTFDDNLSVTARFARPGEANLIYNPIVLRGS